MEGKFIIGVSDILEIGSDLEIDIPKFWDTLISLLVAPVMDGNLSLGALCEASRTKEPRAVFRAKFLAALLHGMRAESESRVAGVWTQAGVDLKTFLTDDKGTQVIDFRTGYLLILFFCIKCYKGGEGNFCEILSPSAVLWTHFVLWLKIR